MIEIVLGLATAVVSLLAAALGLRAVLSPKDDPEPPLILPPTDVETKTFIEQTVWERATGGLPSIYQSSRPPVIAVANMKGGVGKTTIAANLAAHLAAGTSGKRVLLIDFDYQGSLTQTVMGHMGVTEGQMTAHHLLMGRKSPEDAINFAPPMRLGGSDRGQLRLFRATYPLATVENELMVEWITKGEKDVRYILLNYMASEEFKSQYDFAILDCPPRITTGTINALTAASHVLIPSQPDGLSLPAAEYFSLQLRRIRPTVFPNLKLLGVVPSLTNMSTRLTDKEEEVLKEYGAKLKGIWGLEDDPIWRDAFVPRSGPIRDSAGRGLAYLRNPAAKTIFARLGERLKSKL